MRRLAASVVLVAVASVVAMSSVARASNKDPRVCSAYPNSARHAYGCAKSNAVAAVRTAMATRQKVPRWFPAVYCDQQVTLLRWDCQTFSGGDHWAVTVTFRASSAGWRTLVAVTKTR